MFCSRDILNGAFQTTISYVNTSDQIATAVLDVKESVLTISDYKSGAKYNTQF
nr:hypothetical protein [uncultured Flavobacterium sp.]